MKDSLCSGNNLLKCYVWLACALWTLTLLGLCLWTVHTIYSDTMSLASETVKTHFNKNQAFRTWAASQGGIYVFVNPHTPPNPYLSHVPEQNVETPSGNQLTLMNAAYMMRRIHEYYSDAYDIHARLTSLKPLRPENAPDPWETAALNKFQHGVNRVVELASINGKPFLRYMKPLVVEPACLKCHSAQGYNIGDIIGGESVSLPMEHILSHYEGQRSLVLGSYGAVWALGIVGILLAHRHIRGREDERDVAVRLLVEREEQYRELVDSAGDLVGRTDAYGKFQFLNPTALKLTGYSPNELIGSSCLNLVPPELRNAVDDFFIRQREKKIPETYYEIPILRKDGAVIWFGSTVQTLLKNGEVVGFHVIARDITDHKQSQNAIAEHRRRLHAILAHIPDLLWMKDANGVFLLVNEAFSHQCGMQSPEDLLDKTDFDIWPKDLAESYRRDDLEVMAKGTRKIVEEPIMAPEGAKWFQTFKTPLFDAAGRLIGTVGSARDTTERRVAEDTIREQNRFLTTILESLTYPFVVINAADYTIELSNTAGRRRCDKPGKSCFEVCQGQTAPCSHLDHPCPVQSVKRKGEPIVFEHLQEGPDGERTILEVHGYPVFDEQGNVRSVIEYMLDVTDRKMVEAMALQTTRYKAVVDLSMGIAHNFNNLLQIIIGNVNLAALYLEAKEHETLPGILTQILETARAGADTVRQLNRFAKTSVTLPTGTPELFDLSALAQETVRLAEPVWKSQPQKSGLHLSLSESYAENCTVKGIRHELMDTTLNLIRNAVDAMPQGGKIEIRTRIEGDTVRLSISDTGKGIRSGDINRLFTPFYTTSAEPGRGLGLATSRRIIDEHGGIIMVDSVEGKGSTFSIILPRAETSCSSDEVLPDDDVSGQLTVLIIDDLPDILDLLKCGLELLGHRVFTTLSGDEGLKLTAENSPDVVISDLSMPGMSGWEVGKRLKERATRKRAKKPIFIVLTGCDDDLDQTARVQAGVDALLTKPVGIDVLSELIERLCATDGESDTPVLSDTVSES